MQLTENVEKIVKCEICIPLYKPRINSQLPEKWLTARFVFLTIDREKFRSYIDKWLTARFVLSERKFAANGND